MEQGHLNVRSVVLEDHPLLHPPIAFQLEGLFVLGNAVAKGCASGKASLPVPPQ